MVKLFLFAVVGTLLLPACGPVDYLNTVTLKATRAVADAKAANAEKLAPYEYWSALTYLQMAREKVGYADYEDAVDYGEKSEKMAIKAKKLAAEKGQEGPAARRATHAPAQVITQPEAKQAAPPAKRPTPPAKKPAKPPKAAPATPPAKTAPAKAPEGGNR